MSVRGAAVLLCALAVVSGCAKPPPLADLSKGRAAVDEFLAHADDGRAITALIGTGEQRCVEVSGDSYLCQWRLGNSHAGWKPIANALGASDQLNLLCELPTDGGPREPGSCVAFPRRSNRGHYTLPNSRTSAEARERAAQRARYRDAADREIDAAQNAVALSHLVGAAPEHCTPIDAKHRGCVWRASSRTYGHGTLAASIVVSSRERVRLECRLPLDGGPRDPDSCRIRVGA